jgi:hypothetical protein
MGRNPTLPLQARGGQLRIRGLVAEGMQQRKASAGGHSIDLRK